jgi:inner membrane protein involved in colicin E2 resistance
MIFSTVDLPAPFRPSRPILAPGKKLSEMSLMICRLGGTVLLTPVHGVDVLRESRLLTPTQLEIDGSMGTQTRRRGLFEARVYDVDMQIGARFAMPALPAASDDVIEQRIVGAALVLGLGDARGVRAVQARLGGVALTPEPGSGLAWNAAGLHLPLTAAMWQSPLDLKLDLDLIGTESLAVVAGG